MGVIPYNRSVRPGTLYESYLTEFSLFLFTLRLTTGLNPLYETAPRKSVINSANSEIRANVSWALGELRVEEAVEPLIERLKDEEPTVRENSSVALEKLEDVRAIEPLLTLLNDPNEDVNKCACNALVIIAESPRNWSNLSAKKVLNKLDNVKKKKSIFVSVQYEPGVLTKNTNQEKPEETIRAEKNNQYINEQLAAKGFTLKEEADFNVDIVFTERMAGKINSPSYRTVNVWMYTIQDKAGEIIVKKGSEGRYSGIFDLSNHYATYCVFRELNSLYVNMAFEEDK